MFHRSCVSVAAAVLAGWPVAATAGGVSATVARAADPPQAPAAIVGGVTATAVAFRQAPADLIVITFDARRKLSAEIAATARDPGEVLAAALRKRGLKVRRRISSWEIHKPRRGGGGMKLFGDDPSKPPKMPIYTHQTLHVSEFKTPHDVLSVLTELALHQSGSMTMQSTRFAAVSDELELEAAATAHAKAKRLAAQLQLAPGPVVEAKTSVGQARGFYMGPDGKPQVRLEATARVTLRYDIDKGQ